MSQDKDLTIPTEDYVRNSLWMVILSIQMRVITDLVMNASGIKEGGREQIANFIIEGFKEALKAQAKEDKIPPGCWKMYKEEAAKVIDVFRFHFVENIIQVVESEDDDVEPGFYYGDDEDGEDYDFE